MFIFTETQYLLAQLCLCLLSTIPNDNLKNYILVLRIMNAGDDSLYFNR